jgi:hypothetical protein
VTDPRASDETGLDRQDSAIDLSTKSLFAASPMKPSGISYSFTRTTHRMQARDAL